MPLCGGKNEGMKKGGKEEEGREELEVSKIQTQFPK